MSKNAAEELRRRAAAITQRHQATDTETTVPNRGAAPPLHRPVRRTVDLSPARHDQLDEWQRETARELGRARVTGQDVLRTLVARLLTDETLARKIRAHLRDDKQ